MRGVPLDDVMAAMERADLTLLLVLSVPAYIAAVWVRALRWRWYWFRPEVRKAFEQLS